MNVKEDPDAEPGTKPEDEGLVYIIKLGGPTPPDTEVSAAKSFVQITSADIVTRNFVFCAGGVGLWGGCRTCGVLLASGSFCAF